MPYSGKSIPPTAGHRPRGAATPRHRGRVRRLAALALATVAAAGLAPVAAASPSAAARPGSSAGIAWSPCPQDATAECGTLSLPVDWDRPDGPRFDLALARRTATDPTARVGTLVFGPGGPGDSGVSRVVTGIGRFTDELRRRFDIVSFDPRGVGRSQPVVCSAELLSAQPSPLLRDQADFDATLAYNRRLRQDCRARTGPIFDHVDTGSMARDLDAVRAALGERRLTYHGSSYGTLLGEQYAELFPGRVRAVLLESVVDHSLATRDFLDTQAATAQDSFDQFVAWCTATASCALHGRDVRGLWADLMARAGRGELADPKRPSVALTPYTLSVLAQRAFYGPDWAELAETLAALATGGRPAPLAAPVTGAREPAVSTSDGTATAPFPFAVFCQDWALPVRDYREYAEHLRRMAGIAPDTRYPQALMAMTTCLGAPTPVDNPQHRLRVDTDRPLLLVNSLHDPASGYNWASNVARQLGTRGVLLTYEGSGHGIYNVSPCMASAAERYLVSLELPAPGARCPEVGPTTAVAGAPGTRARV
ncbi:alpha/beta fold hydrolase [Micromonospora sp. NPDC049559]|uniref:alpha/beta fold hydrolase n=1 Tax=Micromonospora sp. NPDC049559 TaxID=3155923 RepID=UPI003433A89F